MGKTILVVGNGKLADSILNKLPGYLSHDTIDSWDNRGKYSAENTVLIHIGSGRQLHEALQFCSLHKAPLIQGSTGITIEKTYDFTFIDAPNLNILILKFMHMLKEYGKNYSSYKTSLIESHQHTKKSVPGTAVEIGASLGIDSSRISSIRNRDEQKNIYGISEEHLDLHAYHDIAIEDGDTTINLKTLVRGHDSYVSGLMEIITCLDKLDNRYYHILELVELGLL